MPITSIQEAEKILQAYVPAVKQFTGASINLDRMSTVMKALGNPEQKLRVVHVAGTSGKTSTSYYAASLLQYSGYKTGLTVSPHIDSITERIQINGAPISDNMFCSYLSECIDLIAHVPIQPSYFELLMALAYYVFYKEGVDWAVIETGMGGLLDASNIATKEDKVCVITDIGYDHMHILGSTIAEIAAQKAGIIQHTNAVFMYKQSHEVMTAIRSRVEEKHAHLHLVNDTTIHSNNERMPEYQKRNWQLAYETVQYIATKDAVSVPRSAATISREVYIPGRMEIVQIAGKTLIMDGAHNAQKMHAFVSSMHARFPRTKATIVLAMKEGKEYEEVIDCLLPISESIYATSFSTSQDLPAHATSPETIAVYAKSIGLQNVYVESDAQRALEAALEGSAKIVIVTGSFYLLAQLRQRAHLQHNY